jgi:hypothetical protein
MSNTKNAQARAYPTEWSEFAAAIEYLSRRDQAVVMRIIRRVEVLQAEHGVDVAEAALEQIIGYLAKGGRPRLI